MAIKGGLSNLKKAKPPPPKPKVCFSSLTVRVTLFTTQVENPLEVAFNLTVLQSRRAAIEGLNDNDDDEEYSPPFLLTLLSTAHIFCLLFIYCSQLALGLTKNGSCLTRCRDEVVCA